MSADPSLFPRALRNGHHPNSREALLRYKKEWPQQRKCWRCGTPAMRGVPWCHKHNGSTGVNDVSPARLDQRHLDLLRKHGLLPADLIVTPLWQDLAGLGMATRAPLQRAIVMLWDRRESEPAAFGQVWRHAQKVAKRHGSAR